jgi:hypothetical protein
MVIDPNPPAPIEPSRKVRVGEETSLDGVPKPDQLVKGTVHTIGIEEAQHGD